MKLLKKFVFLTVCGLMTVRGVVAMEEKPAPEVAGTVEVVAPEKQPVDGAAEASAPASVLSEEQRAFLREKIVDMHSKDSPLEEYISGVKKDGDVRDYCELIERCNDAELFLKYIESCLRLAAHRLFLMPCSLNELKTFDERLNFDSRLSNCLSTMITKLRTTGDKLQGKKLTLAPDVDLFSFFTSVWNFTNNLDVCSRCCEEKGLTLIEEIEATLLAQVTAVFAEGEALREITDKIKHSFALEAIQKERSDEQ